MSAALYFFSTPRSRAVESLGQLRRWAGQRTRDKDWACIILNGAFAALQNVEAGQLGAEASDEAERAFTRILRRYERLLGRKLTVRDLVGFEDTRAAAPVIDLAAERARRAS